MRRRLPLILGATALAVALFGSTPLGEAARNAIPPLAKKANFAANAGAVNGLRASRTPKPNYLVPLGGDGKFPASVGAIGPPGPVGPRGDAGLPGVSGLLAVSVSSGADSSSPKTSTATCPLGKRVLGGGATIVGGGLGGPAVTQSQPVGGGATTVNAWIATAEELGTYAASWRLIAYAVCATVTS